MTEKKEIKVIPPNPKYDKHIRVEQKNLNVAAYCRVSTRFEQQENSFEAQIKYFTEKISANPLWNCVGIYSDQGKTATSTKRRDSFNDMVEDCYAGKIDLILTKSISRFARNTVDLLRIVRELKDRHVRIIFEKENIDTMDSTGEILITILSSQAQEESRNLSENTRWGIVRKFEQGLVHINHKRFMGYTKDEEGRLVIVPEEAEVVKRIFDLYLQGLGTYKIAKILEKEGIKTAAGKDKWYGTTIYKMLISEKYVGDAMLQKTYTIDFITKKRVKNDGYVKRYYIENNHEAIISREQYYMVQEELKRRNNKMAFGIRYSGKYPFSGMILCGECNSKYLRVTWYGKKDKKKIPVWRCIERFKNGTKKCKESRSLREDMLYRVILEKFQIIINSEIETASAQMLQTKALIVSCIGANKVDELTMTKAMWDSIIEEIIVKERDVGVIRFRTEMIMEVTLY
ncbi:recombinase family protein [Aminipila sp.]|uniref:recombinase family protein n=1 Tax=Aminipila sp. TaxID=2060095 RepID=UPI00289C1D7D|nr:recombinase family protein [Aminipila sp.]